MELISFEPNILTLKYLIMIIVLILFEKLGKSGIRDFRWIF